MKTISLKIQDKIFHDTEEVLQEIKISRNRYINEAIDFYNIVQKRKMIEEQLSADSLQVSGDAKNSLPDIQTLDDGI